MIPQTFKEVIDLGDGREISIETGKLAKQAHGSVVVKSGKCMLLCTVVSNYHAADVDFLPLTVDYRENLQQREDTLAVSLKERRDRVMVRY
ncbi:polyribonucleotide nucleotidyltransferase [Jejuia pallidilutea]|uniref:Polyribonucleotide nucleotidyltransferase n=1 Tax=Jejuia pallidilutea TaxID=504487 RepID=A0A090WWI0_9FLAO|nr:polyribonucleotide nucleotidyltransferase [Jejuia pallidilutea]